MNTWPLRLTPGGDLYAVLAGTVSSRGPHLHVTVADAQTGFMELQVQDRR